MGKLALLSVLQMLLLLITCCSSVRSEDDNSTYWCVEEEREALLTLKRSFGGPSIHRLWSWQGRDCCGWDGVTCDKSTGHVLELDLRAPFNESNDFYRRWEALEAKELDPSLVKLKYLKHLDLSDNDFQFSSIPQFLGQMKGLTYLNLSFACLSGRVPSHLGNLSNLEFLDLSRNDILGALYVDDLRWVSSLPSLLHLDMGSVDLSRAAPKSMQYVLTQLHSLLHLDLSGCLLNNTHIISLPSTNSTFFPPTLRYLNLSHNSFYSTPIPVSLQNLTYIEVLDLSYNLYNSTIPLWLGSFNNLQSLNLANNKMNSPDEEIWLILRNLSSLHILDMSYNHLSGIIPSSIGRLTLLSSLHLHGNQFNGTIPSSIGRLSSLISLDLSSNQLSGIIPSSIERLTFLSSLDLSRNQFSGIIPSSIGRLSSLISLDLSNNKFRGSIPSSLCRLAALRRLELSNNNLNGTISRSLGQLSNLRVLDISNNLLHGVIPESLGQLVNLEDLHVDSNALEGVVSSKYHLANLSSLTSIRMGSNHLITFRIEPNWLPPFQLEYVGLSSCKFETRRFPTWLRTQNRVRELDLSNTSISDTFPLWLLESKPFLHSLDLSHNQIKGFLPPHRVNDANYLYDEFDEFIMTDNMLNGSIPNWFCNIEIDRTLDLSKNNFSGHIPNCWNSNTSIKVINLSSNQLSGNIPSSFQYLPLLKWLLLSNNNLTGPIPLGLSKVKLSTLDLGSNKLSGNIPTWIGESIPILQILNLRNNMFEGTIPPQLCQLSVLQIIDLSDNDLEGSIPTCLGNLAAMKSQQPLTNYDPKLGLPPFADVWNKSNIKQVMQGRELEYTSVLKYLVNIDLSGNRLVGSIPQELTYLSELVGLNLGRNRLSGSIPKNIGDMRSLLSLDLSHNQLSGEIPGTISALTSLSYLNLSSNNLEGKIPHGNQLQTLNDLSIYQGNPHLCGPPLLQPCPENNSTRNDYGGDARNEDRDNALGKMWLYIVVMAGYATGFWAVVGVLLANKSWRQAYFTYVDEIKDKVYVAVAVKMRVGQPQ